MVGSRPGSTTSTATWPTAAPPSTGSGPATSSGGTTAPGGARLDDPGRGRRLSRAVPARLRRQAPPDGGRAQATAALGAERSPGSSDGSVARTAPARRERGRDRLGTARRRAVLARLRSRCRLAGRGSSSTPRRSRSGCCRAAARPLPLLRWAVSPAARSRAARRARRGRAARRSHRSRSPRSRSSCSSSACALPRSRRRIYLLGALGSGLGVFLLSPFVASIGSHVLWSGPTVPVLGPLDITREELRIAALPGPAPDRGRARVRGLRAAARPRPARPGGAVRAPLGARDRAGDEARADARARRRRARRGAARARGGGRRRCAGGPGCSRRCSPARSSGR